MLRQEIKLGRIRWVGWLYSDVDGKWQCGLKRTSGQLRGSLMVLAGPPTHWLVVATIEDERIQWKLQGAEPLVNGMPVFFTQVPPVP